MTKTVSRRVLSPSQAAAYIGVHLSTINRWTEAGLFAPKIQLSPYRIGYLTDDIDAWLDERKHKTSGGSSNG